MPDMDRGRALLYQSSAPGGESSQNSSSEDPLEQDLRTDRLFGRLQEANLTVGAAGLLRRYLQRELRERNGAS